MRSPTLRSGLRLIDATSEALAGLLQRPGRSLLTMLGTVLGVGSFVAILGLTASARAAVNSSFSALLATQVTVTDLGPTALQGPQYSFPSDTDTRLTHLNGAVAAGVMWKTPLSQPAISARATGGLDERDAIDVYAATPGLLAAAELTGVHGRTFGSFHQDRGEPVALVSDSAAKRLSLPPPDRQPAVFLDGVPYAVIGTFTTAERAPTLSLGILIPAGNALATFGPPELANPATALIKTRLGATRVIARQAALAIDAAHPELFQAVTPPTSRSLQDNVTDDVDGLLLILAGLALLLGAVGITNTTLVAVIERSSEIGLRRAFGACPRHIAGQFLLESTALGLLGGLAGAALAVVAVVATAAAQGWTAVIIGSTLLGAPAIGAAVGLIAGLYPAMRAARIEPVEALQR